jgi:uncharacterized protein (TIGR00369 family)
MDFPVQIPFVESLGFELLRFEGGEAELAVELRDELTNSWGVAHGGVTMTLLDVAMAHAARSPDAATANAARSRGNAAGDRQRGVVTVEMKTAFMRPGMGRLVARAKLLHRTASMAFCEGPLFDTDGKLIAHAAGTFKYLAGLPAGGRKIKRLNASD